jgi:hypothetical protein
MKIINHFKNLLTRIFNHFYITNSKTILVFSQTRDIKQPLKLVDGSCWWLVVCGLCFVTNYLQATNYQQQVTSHEQPLTNSEVIL